MADCTDASGNSHSHFTSSCTIARVVPWAANGRQELPFSRRKCLLIRDFLFVPWYLRTMA